MTGRSSASNTSFRAPSMLSSKTRRTGARSGVSGLWKRLGRLVGSDNRVTAAARSSQPAAAPSHGDGAAPAAAAYRRSETYAEKNTLIEKETVVGATVT